MSHLFPVYFAMQSALPVLLALTYPGSGHPFGARAGLAGVLARGNRWSVLAPLAGAWLCAVVNWGVVGPLTTGVMEERRVQGMFFSSFFSFSFSLFYFGLGSPRWLWCWEECCWLTGVVWWTEKKDGKKSYDAPPHSQEMVALNKRFGMLHGVSSLLNLGTLVATVVYGVTLSSRLV